MIGLTPSTVENSEATGGSEATECAIELGTPCDCSPRESVCGRWAASPAIISEKKAPIESAVPEFALDVTDLGGCARWVKVDETAGELGFEDDQRKGVAEDVVEVACDALPLSERGEGHVLLLGETELAIGAPLLGPEDVAATDDDHEEEGDESVRPADMKEGVRRYMDRAVVALRENDEHLGEDERYHAAHRLDGEGKEGGGVDEERGRSLVPGEGYKAEEEGGDDHRVAERRLRIGGVHVENEDAEEGEEDGGGGGPHPEGGVEDGIDEEEAGVGEPEPCPVAAALLRDGVGGRHGEALWESVLGGVTVEGRPSTDRTAAAALLVYCLSVYLSICLLSASKRFVRGVGRQAR